MYSLGAIWNFIIIKDLTNIPVINLKICLKQYIKQKSSNKVHFDFLNQFVADYYFMCVIFLNSKYIYNFDI